MLDCHYSTDIDATDIIRGALHIITLHDTVLEGLGGYSEDEVRHVSVLCNDLQPRDGILISDNVRNLMGPILLYPRKVIVPCSGRCGGRAGAGGGGHANDTVFIAQSGQLDHASQCSDAGVLVVE